MTKITMVGKRMLLGIILLILTAQMGCGAEGTVDESPSEGAERPREKTSLPEVEYTHKGPSSLDPITITDGEIRERFRALLAMIYQRAWQQQSVWGFYEDNLMLMLEDPRFHSGLEKYADDQITNFMEDLQLIESLDEHLRTLDFEAWRHERVRAFVLAATDLTWYRVRFMQNVVSYSYYREDNLWHKVETTREVMFQAFDDLTAMYKDLDSTIDEPTIVIHPEADERRVVSAERGRILYDDLDLFGRTKDEIRAMLGEPTGVGDWSGAEYFRYENRELGIFFPYEGEYSGRVVEIGIADGSADILGVSIGMTLEEVSLVLGAPDTEGEYPPDWDREGFFYDYLMDSYQITFTAPRMNGQVTQAMIRILD